MLSHEHCDHIGAITSALHEGLEVFYPASSSVLFQKEAEKPERPPWHAHAVSASAEIAPGITSTGEMGKKVVEQALVVDGSEGPILVTGCAHPGIVEMARAATHIAGEPISLVIGGFHLYKSKNPEIRKIAGALRQLGVKRLAPCHCTGESAIKLLLEAFGPDGLDVMAGTHIAM